MHDYTSSAQYAESRPLPVRPWVIDTARKVLAIITQPEFDAAIESFDEDRLSMISSGCDVLSQARAIAFMEERAAFVAPLFPEMAA